MLSNKHALRIAQMPVLVVEDPVDGGCLVANKVAMLAALHEAQHPGTPFVLGVITGSTPETFFDALAELHSQGVFSTKNLYIVMVDDFELPESSILSFREKLKRDCLRKIGLPVEQVIFVPNRATCTRREYRQQCQETIERLNKLGGRVHLGLVGFGINGHFFMVEPWSFLRRAAWSAWRPIVLLANHITGKNWREEWWQTELGRVRLHDVTRRNAAGGFGGLALTPRHGTTFGGRLLLERTDQLIALSFGTHKAPITELIVCGPVTPRVPASIIQEHPNVCVVVDHSAAQSLSQIVAPYCFVKNWKPESAKQARKASLWLARRKRKPLLKLTDDDYTQNGLGEMARELGGAGEANRLAHAHLVWAFDFAFPTGRESIVLGDDPHSDDLLLQMGVTICRIVERGHHFHAALLTGGWTNVWDKTVRELVNDFKRLSEVAALDRRISRRLEKLHFELLTQLEHRNPEEAPTGVLREIKRLIRRLEEFKGLEFLGVPRARVKALDLPFYEGSWLEKLPYTQADVDARVRHMRQVKASVYFVAGDILDPHGTHWRCLEIFAAAIEVVKDDDWFPDEVVILAYDAAWSGISIDRIDFAVAFGREEEKLKDEGFLTIYRSQIRALFSGIDKRPFNVRVRERSRALAKEFKQLGIPLPEGAVGIEGFFRLTLDELRAMVHRGRRQPVIKLNPGQLEPELVEFDEVLFVGSPRGAGG